MRKGAIHYLNEKVLMTKCGLYRLNNLYLVNVDEYVDCENCLRVMDKEDKEDNDKFCGKK